MNGSDRVGRRALLAGLAGLPLLSPLAAAAGVAESAPESPPENASEGSARPPVDLALVLAVDASASISRDALDFQLRGHAAAFRDPRVAAAVARGGHGRIAVTLVQFASPDTLTALVPWRLVAGAADCAAMADAIDAVPGIAMGGSTALGSAIVAAVAVIERAPWTAARRKIDLVSNGFNNAGIDPLSARAHAAAAGITVNALAILDEFDWLEAYYAENVIAGEGAFVRTAGGADDFATAFLSKLMAEIA